LCPPPPREDDDDDDDGVGREGNSASFRNDFADPVVKPDTPDETALAKPFGADLEEDDEELVGRDGNVSILRTLSLDESAPLP